MLPLLVLAGYGADAVNDDSTSFAVAGAMSDGSSIAAQSADADGSSDFRLVHVPRRMRPSNHTGPWMRDVYGSRIEYPRIKDASIAPQYSEGPDGLKSVPEGQIPEVNETLAYWDGSYGIQNEYQVSIGESSCSARYFTVPKSKGGRAIMWVGALSKIALERCKTARCAVQSMGDLGYEYGFYAENSASMAGESLVVVDPHEAWVFHILASPCGTRAIWGAQRVPKGNVAAVANAFTIRKMNLTDSDSFLASPGIVEIANLASPKEGRKKGKKRHHHHHHDDDDNDDHKSLSSIHEHTFENLDFTRAFGAGEYTHVFYSQRRVWRIYDILAPSLGLDPKVPYSVEHETLPFSIKPDAPIELSTLFAIYRDYYQGTEYDVTKGRAAGPFGNPARYDAGPEEEKMKNGGWERSIGLYRTSYIELAQARPQESGGVLWFAPSRAEATIFLPVLGPTILPTAPGTLGEGNNWKLDDGFWWTAQQLAAFMELKFSAMQPEVNELQRRLEREGEELVKSLLKNITKPEGHIGAQQFVPEFIDHAHKELENLRRHLLVKHQNGYVLDVKTQKVQTPGYDKAWLKDVGFCHFQASKKDWKRFNNTHLETQSVGTEIMNLALAALQKNETWKATPNVIQGLQEDYYQQSRKHGQEKEKEKREEKNTKRNIEKVEHEIKNMFDHLKDEMEGKKHADDGPKEEGKKPTVIDIKEKEHVVDGEKQHEGEGGHEREEKDTKRNMVEKVEQEIKTIFDHLKDDEGRKQHEGDEGHKPIVIDIKKKKEGDGEKGNVEGKKHDNDDGPKEEGKKPTVIDIKEKQQVVDGEKKHEGDEGHKPTIVDIKEEHSSGKKENDDVEGQVERDITWENDEEKKPTTSIVDIKEEKKPTTILDVKEEKPADEDDDKKKTPESTLHTDVGPKEMEGSTDKPKSGPGPLRGSGSIMRKNKVEEGAQPRQGGAMEEKQAPSVLYE